MPTYPHNSLYLSICFLHSVSLSIYMLVPSLSLLLPEPATAPDAQVDASGRSWRSGALVERRMLPQWFLSITSYAKVGT